MKLKSFQIRLITKEDNLAVANIIREVMTEFECVGDGYSINDPEVDYMFEAYDKEDSSFFVIEEENSKKVLGCGGVAPLKNASPDICELQKMYFKKELRGHGMGQRLLDICLGEAVTLGFKKCYLETTFRMNSANALYKKNGFKPLKASQGNTGHSGCDTFYILDLKSTNPFKELLTK